MVIDTVGSLVFACFTSHPLLCENKKLRNRIHAYYNGMLHVTCTKLTLTVLVTTIDAQWEGMGDVGSARYEPALLPPCPTIRVLSYSN